jgi:hypothetical protein
VIALAAPLVEWSTLGRVIASTLVVGIGVTIVFSLVVWGAVRASDDARAARSARAAVHGVVATVGLVVIVAVVAYGLHILAKK